MPEEKGRMVSPQEMFDAAKETMLEGKGPSNGIEWALIVNFIALNIAEGLEEPVMRIMKLIFDIPLEDEYIERICAHQLSIKRREKIYAAV